MLRQRRLAKEARKNRAENIKRKLSLNVPPKYRPARLKRLYGNLSVLITGNRSVYLWGDTGRGKTYAAMAATIQAIVEGKIVKAVSFDDLIAKIREFKQTENHILEPIFNADLTVLDDVAISSTEFNGRILLRIIENRLSNLKKTIITSNLTLEALESFYGSLGQRIKSRLFEYEIIRLSGQDQRELNLKKQYLTMRK